MENALQVVNLEDYALTPERVQSQVNLIQKVMEQVMKPKEHYDVIPGTGRPCPDCQGKGCEKCKGMGRIGKPSLLKPGAEKLSVTFHLAPKYDVTKSDLGHGHREYEVTCTLTLIGTDTFIGQGVGSCSTMEGKYRFRTGEVESTGKPVPKDYWKDRNQKLIGGKGFSVKKIDGRWMIVRQGDRVDHDNPADYYNTVLKMAKKRAHVDAILTATAASDIFTQDVEDMPEVIDITPEKGGDADDPGQPTVHSGNMTAPSSQQPNGGGGNGKEPLTNPQRKRIYALLKDKDLSKDEIEEFHSFLVMEPDIETIEVDGKHRLTKAAVKGLFDNGDALLSEKFQEFKDRFLAEPE